MHLRAALQQAHHSQVTAELDANRSALASSQARYRLAVKATNDAIWDWDLTVDLVRWMTSFATTDEDVQRFAAGVSAVLADHA